ncbi:uncharacterized protein LOC119640322 [Glossina fuscipes]|uniref:Uncharacterized protein LOC119640322 n=1 Tax=Glossina fuscipes TaxID=7396 RepID=A0A9C5ZDY4_9MUSC|nr:uncharacterized protein LOC119640322 [Glossina fuscipes]
MSASLPLVANNHEKSKQQQSKVNGNGQKYESRHQLPYLFEKELINKQNKYIHIHETFIPCAVKTNNAIGKFYINRDQLKPIKYISYLKLLERLEYNKFLPSGMPRLESQVYGWMPCNVKRSAILGQLNYINAPKRRCYLTIHGEKLHNETITERTPFNGVRFLLQ